MNYEMLFWFETNNSDLTETGSNPSSAHVSVTHISISLFCLTLWCAIQDRSSIKHTQYSLCASVSELCSEQKRPSQSEWKLSLCCQVHTQKVTSVSLFSGVLRSKASILLLVGYLNKPIILSINLVCYRHEWYFKSCRLLKRGLMLLFWVIRLTSEQ